jgi:hypothetical protein
MPMLLVFVCADCGLQSSACPECVNAVRIDPETGLPPDVEIVDGRAVPKTPPISEDAVHRSEPCPVCDACISLAIRRGKAGLMTAADRHRRLHV